MPDLQRALARIDSDLDASVERLFTVMRIPSISTDPAYADDCRRAAEVAAADLASMGFEASVRNTAGQPVVVAHWTRTDPGGPRVLFYGHYDVQPVDPLEAWTSPPFEPRLVSNPDGSKAIVGRGAADDKGQFMTFFEACRAFVAQGGLPVQVSVFLEGEEECGSPSLAAFLEANRQELTKDVALVCDTGLWDRATPSIPVTLRGLVAEEVTVFGANRDLHSGGYGSAARNPNQVIADIVSALRGADGSVTIPGFYDGVGEPSPDLRELWDQVPFSSKDYLAGVGLSLPAGEKGRSVREMVWSRPTCEINGLGGGYTGMGFKTVLPAKATAKISFRLVGDQDPETVRARFREFVSQRVPEDCRVEFSAHGGSRAIKVAWDTPYVAKARSALEDEWGRPPVLPGNGGSIPAVGEIKRVLGMDSLLIGFAMRDDRIHAPNEKYEMASFHKGARSWLRILHALGT